MLIPVEIFDSEQEQGDQFGT